MDSLKTDHPLALSFLFNEELYILKDDVTINVETSENSTEPKASVLETTVTKSGKPVFEYLGANNRYILIIINEPSQKFINKKDLDFLLKILSAKNLDLNDIAIINTANYESLNFQDLKDYFGLAKILTFGINPASLNISGITPNKEGEFQGVKILGTWALSQLEADVKKKAIYWKELKPF